MKKAYAKREIWTQAWIVGTIVLLFFTSACIDKRQEWQIYSHIFALTILGDIVCITGWLVLWVSKFKSKIDDSKKIYWKEKRWLLFVLTYSFIIRVVQIGNIPKWDGAFYYNALINACNNFDFSFQQYFSGFMPALHPMWGYFSILAIGEFLATGKVIGIFVINMLLTLLAVYCIFKILERMCGKKNQRFLAAATCLVSSLPVFAGTFSNCNPDMGAVFFAIYFFYCYLKKKYILMSFSAILLITSKETGILTYAGISIGIFLWECLKKEDTLKKKISNIVKDPAIILAVILGIIAIFALFVYLLYGGHIWSMKSESDANMSTFKFIPSFFGNNIKQFFILNFNWLLCALSVYSLFHIYRNRIKIKTEKSLLGGMIGAYVLLILFFSLYITYSLSRYHILLDVLTAMLTIILFSFVEKTLNWKCKVLSLLSGFMLIQSYFTIDPMSVMFFENYDTENGMILSTASPNEAPSGDYTLYNHQYTNIDVAANMILKEIGYDGNMDIIMYDWYRDLRSDYIFWDTKRNELTFCQNLDTVPVNVVEGGMLDVNAAQHNQAVYIYYPQIDDSIDTWLECLEEFYDIRYTGEVNIPGGGKVYYWMCDYTGNPYA